MSTPRQKRKPVFNPHALDDDLDELLHAGPPQPPRPLVVADPVTPPRATEVAPPPDHAPNSAGGDPQTTPSHTMSSETHAQTAPTSAPDALTEPERSPQQHSARSPLRSVPAPSADAQTRHRPPEVNLAAEVYDALYQLQIAEKKTRKGLARPMGTIVLDAIEKHADRLQRTWAATEETVGEGGLFVRPSTSAVPRRRRHAVAPRTVVLSGVNPINGRKLDALVEAWGAGTRSALVEQALRYEFNLT